MNREDLRVACETCGRTGFVGRYSHVDSGTGAHLGDQPIPCLVCNGTAYRPITLADLEGLGEKVDWCAVHGGVFDGQEWTGMDPTLRRCYRFLEANKPCEITERILIAPQESLEVGE